MNNRYNNSRSVLAARGLCHKLALCLSIIIYPVTGASAQMKRTGVLPPPTPDLIAVQLPDTQGMEPDVREHLRLVMDALAAAIKEPTSPADKLAEAYGTTGQVFHAYTLIPPAKECYTNAARLAPKDFRWPYLLGKATEMEGEADAAIKFYTTARSLRPDYLPVLVNLGNIHLQLNRTDEAESFFKGALELNGMSSAALYGLGQAALSKRNHTDALRHLKGALKITPQANRIHYSLAMSYRGLGDVERAKSHLALSGTVGVRAFDPLLDGMQQLVKGARLYLARGKLALEARRYAEAIAEFRKALAQQPDSIPANFNLGVALFKPETLKGLSRSSTKLSRSNPRTPTRTTTSASSTRRLNGPHRPPSILQPPSKSNPTT